MNTFRRSILYLITGLAVLSLLALITKSEINILIFIVVPLVVFAFWSASKGSEQANSKGDTTGNTEFGGEDE